MKKRLFSLLATFALGLAILMTGLTSAQTPATQPALSQPTTKIAVLNLSYVVKNYEKYKAFTNEMKKTMSWYETQAKGKKASYDGIVKDLQKEGLPQAQKDKLEKDLMQVQRELEDLSKDGKKYLGTKSDEQLVILYREVQEVAQRYATARGYEMVLHFNDAVRDSQDGSYYSPQNVARKMQAGALMPLYVHPSLDISYQVVGTLNQGYHPQPQPAATPPTSGQPAGKQ